MPYSGLTIRFIVPEGDLPERDRGLALWALWRWGRRGFCLEAEKNEATQSDSTQRPVHYPVDRAGRFVGRFWITLIDYLYLAYFA
ncbi:MAG: hypothetical protein HOP27_09985 [Anaerolineales bacterium]|nr:hypothetical protein [Anaerolineales bacterium]